MKGSLCQSHCEFTLQQYAAFAPYLVESLLLRTNIEPHHHIIILHFLSFCILHLSFILSSARLYFCLLLSSRILSVDHLFHLIVAFLSIRHYPAKRTPIFYSSLALQHYRLPNQRKESSICIPDHICDESGKMRWERCGARGVE